MERTSKGKSLPEIAEHESSWQQVLLDTSHRRIGWLYLFSITLFFLLGGLFGLLLRVEGTTAQESIFSAQTYARLFSMHGLFMVFLFLLPALPSVLGNFLLPAMIGSRDLAFPRLNLLGWCLHFAGGVVLVLTALRGGIETTWSLGLAGLNTEGSGNLLPALVGLALASLAVMLQSINFVVTIHRLRSPGRTWMRLSVFAWSLYLSSLITILASPILLTLLLLLGAGRVLGISFFDPGSMGEPVLLQQLFWFYARPTLYAVILPALGVITESVARATVGAVTARTGTEPEQVVGYRYVVTSLVAIAILSLLTAGSHLLSSGQSAFATLFFSFAGYLTVIPFGVIFAHWLATLYRGFVRIEAAMLFSLGAILVVMVGGLTGLFLIAAGGNAHLHSTVFVVAHFHFLLAGGVTMAYLGALHLWWRDISGQAPNEAWARPAAVVIFAGVNLTFLPLFILGFSGLPRRLYTYPAEFEALNILSFAGATILLVGYLLPILSLAGSLRSGSRGADRESVVVPSS